MCSNISKLAVVGLVAMASVAACAEPSTEVTGDAVSGESESNVLLAEWSGPYNGVPAFDQMDLEALKPALEAGMESALEASDVIANNPEPPSFEN
ncbi:MAG: M3 family peptidase, partial [Gemmatimonadota bacterium]